MYERSQVLARILASVTGERKNRRARTLKTDRALQQLVAERAHCGAATERPVLRNGRRIRRSPEWAGLTIHAIGGIDGPAVLVRGRVADPRCPATANIAFERCRSFCITCVASGTVPIVNTSLLRTGDRNLCLDIALEWRFARRESDDWSKA